MNFSSTRIPFGRLYKVCGSSDYLYHGQPAWYTSVMQIQESPMLFSYFIPILCIKYENNMGKCGLGSCDRVEVVFTYCSLAIIGTISSHLASLSNT